MPFNFYDTHTLLAAVQQLTPATSFLRDRYFPTNEATDIFSTTDVLVEYRDGSRMIAPFVAPRKGGVTMVRQGYEVERYEPPFIAPRRGLSIDDLKKRGFGEALMSKLTPEQRQRIFLLSDAQELSDMITRREEQMAAEVMQTNGCVMKHIADDATDADEMSIRFYSGESNPATYTPTGNWETSYTGIIKDLGVMAHMLKKNGLAAIDLVCGADAADAVLNNEKLQKLLDINNYNVGRVDPIELPNGASNICKLNVKGNMINVFLYEETYRDLDGKTKYYIDPKNVILTAPGAGRTAYGAVSQVEQSDGELHTYPGMRVPKYLSNAEGNTRSITITSCPILMPKAKNPFIVAKVLE